MSPEALKQRCVSFGGMDGVETLLRQRTTLQTCTGTHTALHGHLRGSVDSLNPMHGG